MCGSSQGNYHDRLIQEPIKIVTIIIYAYGGTMEGCSREVTNQLVSKTTAIIAQVFTVCFQLLLQESLTRSSGALINTGLDSDFSNRLNH